MTDYRKILQIWNICGHIHAISVPASHNTTMGEISFVLHISLGDESPSAGTEIMPYYYMSRSILWSLGLVAWHRFGLLA